MIFNAGDDGQVSFAAASIYPRESPRAAPPPQVAHADVSPTPRPVRTPQMDATGLNSRVKAPGRPRGPPADDDELDALDIPTVCRRSGLGRSFVYDSIRRGELRACKFGRLTRVLRQDYQAWLAAAPRIAPAVGHDPTPHPTLIAGRPIRRVTLRS
jgi:excisionase family DNA binding protein